MEIRIANKEDFSELLSFYNRMCSVLGEQDFLPEGDKGGFPSEEMISVRRNDTGIYRSESAVCRDRR